MADDTPDLIDADEGTQVVRLAGEVDVATIDPVRRLAEQAIEAGAHTLVFDLAEVSFLDSAALALFAYTTRHVSRTVLRRPSPLIQRVLRGTGLDAVVEIEP
jgi:anti-anti-sigma factor